MRPDSSLSVEQRVAAVDLFEAGYGARAVVRRPRFCEAYWVLFRFLYWGQLADPCLIIHIDDVGWSVVSERFV